MLFDSLDKIKRNSIFSAILLMALGAVMLLCPENYIDSFTLGAGYLLVIVALVMMLDFFSSRKALMDYIMFVVALVVLILGVCVLIFNEDIMVVLSRLFGILLVADGGRTIFHAFAYARRSERKGWWVLVILSVLLILAGIGIFVNPFFKTSNELMKGIGATVLFSALISAVRLIWTWPLRNTNGGDGNE
jgi:uncharacterized membrane protein HdeD (DUF308 family)